MTTKRQPIGVGPPNHLMQLRLCGRVTILMRRGNESEVII
uniref:Uncharacterized protein n=1 Tax=Arundo donax TaxID=35708 RepID=A0A0A8YM62_ARUDO